LSLIIVDKYSRRRKVLIAHSVCGKLLPHECFLLADCISEIQRLLEGWNLVPFLLEGKCCGIGSLCDPDRAPTHEFGDGSNSNTMTTENK
jgi:hypothetical protein